MLLVLLVLGVVAARTADGRLTVHAPQFPSRGGVDVSPAADEAVFLLVLLPGGGVVLLAAVAVAEIVDAIVVVVVVSLGPLPFSVVQIVVQIDLLHLEDVILDVVRKIVQFRLGPQQKFRRDPLQLTGQADQLRRALHEPSQFPLEVGRIVEDPQVRVSHPRPPRQSVQSTGLLGRLRPHLVVLEGVEPLGSLGGRDHVKYGVVPSLPQFARRFDPPLRQELLPIGGGHVRRAVHQPSIAQ
mmetsp:Transcript_29897/g.88867  ORF Transcript_29897/g.88867 Transcript_29897/m.88867 type:complete len:241 (-) Transcript_29897:680-1402(-)